MRNLKTFENFEIDNNWKFTIKIKHLLDDTDMTFPSEEVRKSVTNKSKSILKELNKLEKNTLNSNLEDDEKQDLESKISDIKSYFEFIINLAGMSEDEWYKNFDYFNGDFQELFNEYLDALYDLCDERVRTKNGKQVKYCWIQ